MAEQKEVGLVERNVAVVLEQYEKDPAGILVAIQLVDDQRAHMASGLHDHIRRRLVPLTLVADLVKRQIEK